MAAEIVKWSAIIGTTVTVLFGIVQYRLTREAEFRRTFWDVQRRVYDEALTATATIAAAKDLASTKTERANFRALYWGRMVGVEDVRVERAMIEFRRVLDECETDPDRAKCFEVPAGERRTPLQTAALGVAYCVRTSLIRTWSPVALGYDDECPHPPHAQPSWWRRAWMW